MGPLSHRASDKWHKVIGTTAFGKFPIDSTGCLDETFPWGLLRSHTDLYLSKKLKLSQQDREARLVSLIQKHEVISTAIAAAGHAISAPALRAMLVEEGHFEHNDQNDFGRFAYLQAISAAKEVNGSAITDIEAHASRLLLQSSGFDSWSNPDPQLESLLHFLLIEDMSTTMILFRPIMSMTSVACKALHQRLEGWRTDGEWQLAYEATRWLLPLQHTLAGANPLAYSMKDMLSRSFPNWMTWATWQPNVDRLLLWSHFTCQNRSQLRQVLALEGPDFATSIGVTLAHGVAAQISKIRCSTTDVDQVKIQTKTGTPDEAREILFRLLRTIDDTSQRAQQNVDLLVYSTVGRPIDQESVTLLECVNSMWSPDVAGTILQFISEENLSGCMSMDCLLQVIPLLTETPGHALRSLLAPRLTARILSCMENIQSDLDTRLRGAVPWTDVALKLIAFGNALKESFLYVLLDPNIRILLSCWPSVREIMSSYGLYESALRNNMVDLMSLLEAFCRSRLIKYDEMRGSRLIKELTDFWERIPDEDLRSTAFLLLEVSRSLPHGSEIFFTLLAEIPALPQDFCNNFQRILQKYQNQPGSATLACIEMTRLLMSIHSNSLTIWRQCNLRRLLRLMLEQQKETLIHQTLEILSANVWLQWVKDICEIFGGVSKVHSLKLPIPSYLFHWAEELTEFHSTITWLEKNLASRSALQCLLLGGGEDEDTLALWLLGILKCSKIAEAGRCQPVFQRTLLFLDSDGKNSKDVCESLRWISDMSSAGEAACEHVLDLNQHSSKHVTEAVLAGCLNASELTAVDKHALRGLSRVLGFDCDTHTLLPAQTLDAAVAYVDQQAVELQEEAWRLEKLRLSLISADPIGAAALVKSLGIECQSPVDDAMITLPTTLIDVVEKTGEHEVELQFPITHLNWLQRLATGVGDANSLHLRLVLGDDSLPHGFCIHLDNEISSNQHSPWMMFEGCKVPNLRFCGSRISRCAYQLSRGLFRHLQPGFVSLEAIHSFFSDAIQTLAQSCTICGIRSDTMLQRSTVCGSDACLKEYLRSDIDFRLSDIFQDAAVIDVQLTMLYSAAATNNPLLVPTYPGYDIGTITAVLDKMSPVTELRKVGLLETSRGLEHQVKTLLLWLCGNARGFLVSVPEQFRVPSLPGSQQFLLANASPKEEAAFAKHRNGMQSTVLFHGTTMDRLFCILTQGLRSCSGTNLQANGAALGKGIYMAEEPRTAWTFITKAAVAGRKTWKKSPFHGLNVLLGCEYLGTKPAVNPGVHLINDPTTVMVRYIFLIPPTEVVAPLAAHLTPAMLSCFAQLK